jgi:hypothetical protein
MKDPLGVLFLESSPPVDLRAIGRGARLLVPNGAGFGSPQLWHDGEPFDWVRLRRDAYWIEGDRGSQHSGVDFGYCVRGRFVYPLPEGLPVLSPCDARVERAGADADPERGPGGVVLTIGRPRAPRLYAHLTDFRVSVKKGARVRAGDVLGETVRYSRRFPIVVLHFGVGVLSQGAPPNPFDPTPLLKRWRVRHPVFVGSTCNAAALNRGKPGRVLGGVVSGLEPVATYRPEWLDVYD